MVLLVGLQILTMIEIDNLGLPHLRVIGVDPVSMEYDRLMGVNLYAMQVLLTTVIMRRIQVRMRRHPLERHKGGKQQKNESRVSPSFDHAGVITCSLPSHRMGDDYTQPMKPRLHRLCMRRLHAYFVSGAPSAIRIGFRCAAAGSVHSHHWAPSPFPYHFLLIASQPNKAAPTNQMAAMTVLATSLPNMAISACVMPQLLPQSFKRMSSSKNNEMLATMPNKQKNKSPILKKVVMAFTSVFFHLHPITTQNPISPVRVHAVHALPPSIPCW